MPISLHAALVPSMLQLLGSAQGWLAKAAAGPMSETEVLEASLAPDMLPFDYQVKSLAVHSRGAFEGVRRGVFSPDLSDPPASLAELAGLLDETARYLEALTEEEVEALRGGEMRFEVGTRQLPFTVDDFLLSFSQPNFYFHATAAYAILRARGLPLGKRDFLGAISSLPVPLGVARP